MRISDWSSDVCSSDLGKLEKRVVVREVGGVDTIQIRPMAYVSLTIDHRVVDGHQTNAWLSRFVEVLETWPIDRPPPERARGFASVGDFRLGVRLVVRSEEHTSELQSLMRSSLAV